MCTYWNKVSLTKSKSKKNKKIDSIGIGLASPEEIRRWSERRLPNGILIGRVDKDHTVDYESLKPIEGGLFCERIFGPVEDFCCSCDRRGEKNEKFCPNCNVEFTKSRVRRTRMGYIPLAVPVAHVWYLRGRPSYIANLIGRSRNSVDRLAYGETLCESFVGNTYNAFFQENVKNLVQSKQLESLFLNRPSAMTSIGFQSSQKASKHKDLLTHSVCWQSNRSGLPAFNHQRNFSDNKKKHGTLLHNFFSFIFDKQRDYPWVDTTSRFFHTFAQIDRTNKSSFFFELYKRCRQQSLSTTNIKGHLSCNIPFILRHRLHRFGNNSAIVAKLRENVHILQTRGKIAYPNFVRTIPASLAKNRDGLLRVRSKRSWEMVCPLASKTQACKDEFGKAFFLPMNLRKEAENLALNNVLISQTKKGVQSNATFFWQLPYLSSMDTRVKCKAFSFSQPLLTNSSIPLTKFRLQTNPRFTDSRDLKKTLGWHPFLKKSVVQNSLKTWLCSFVGNSTRGETMLYNQKVSNSYYCHSTMHTSFFPSVSLHTLRVSKRSKLGKEVAGEAFSAKTLHFGSGRVRKDKGLQKIEGAESLGGKYNKFHNLPLFSTFIYKEWSHRFSFFEYFIWSAQSDDLALPFYAHQQIGNKSLISSSEHALLKVATNLTGRTTRKNFLSFVKNSFVLRAENYSGDGTNVFSSTVPPILAWKAQGAMASNLKRPFSLQLRNKRSLFILKNNNAANNETYHFQKIHTSRNAVNKTASLARESLEREKKLKLVLRTVERFFSWGAFQSSDTLALHTQRPLPSCLSRPISLAKRCGLKSQIEEHRMQFWSPIFLNKQAYGKLFIQKNRRHMHTLGSLIKKAQQRKKSSNFAIDSPNLGYNRDDYTNISLPSKMVHQYSLQNGNVLSPPLPVSNQRRWYAPRASKQADSFANSLTKGIPIENGTNVGIVSPSTMVDTHEFPTLSELLYFTGGTALRYLLARFDLVLLGKFLRYELKNLEFKVNSLLALKALTYSQGLLLGKLAKRRSKQIRRLKLLELFQFQKSDPAWMILSVLPVLPPDLRPILRVNDDFVVASDLNRLYQTVLRRNNTICERLDDPLPCPESGLFRQRSLQKAVDGLLENGKGGGTPLCASKRRPLVSLSHVLKGKKGLFRQHLLGKRVDYSGRSVIVVGPGLHLHECGLPKEMAMELFQPFLLHRLKVKGLAASNTAARRMVQQEDPVIWHILKQLVYEHPVLLNRAPTLHRLGIQAFQPRLVSGRAILLHPLVCNGFNADFDGDQMAVHIPLSFQARAEAWKIMWAKNNLLSPATGQPILVPSQDMVLGCYYLSVSVPRVLGYLTPTGTNVLQVQHNHERNVYPTLLCNPSVHTQGEVLLGTNIKDGMFKALPSQHIHTLHKAELCTVSLLPPLLVKFLTVPSLPKIGRAEDNMGGRASTAKMASRVVKASIPILGSTGSNKNLSFAKIDALKLAKDRPGSSALLPKPYPLFIEKTLLSSENLSSELKQIPFLQFQHYSLPRFASPNLAFYCRSKFPEKKWCGIDETVAQLALKGVKENSLQGKHHSVWRGGILFVHQRLQGFTLFNASNSLKGMQARTLEGGSRLTPPALTCHQCYTTFLRPGCPPALQKYPAKLNQKMIEGGLLTLPSSYPYPYPKGKGMGMGMASKAEVRSTGTNWNVGAKKMAYHLRWSDASDVCISEKLGLFGEHQFFQRKPHFFPIMFLKDKGTSNEQSQLNKKLHLYLARQKRTNILTKCVAFHFATSRSTVTTKGGIACLNRNKEYYFSNLQDSLLAYFQGRLETHTPFWVRIDSSQALGANKQNYQSSPFNSGTKAGSFLREPSAIFNSKDGNGSQAKNMPSSEQASLGPLCKTEIKTSLHKGLVNPLDMLANKPFFQSPYGSSQKACKIIFQDSHLKTLVESNDTLEAPLELRLSVEGNLMKIFPTLQHHYSYNATMVDQCQEKSIKYMRTTPGRVVINRALFSS